MFKQKAIIIGSGIAGMATALRLAKLGYAVTVYESEANYGGKIGEYRWGDFRFDCGPSLFTLPHLVDELFELFDKNPKQYFNYQKLDVVTKYFFEDEVVINSYAQPQKFAAEIAEKTEVNKNKTLQFLNTQKRTYNLLAPIFIENSIHLFSRLFRFKNIPALFHVMNPRFIKNMNAINSGYFKNDKLVKIFNRYGTYNGSNPYQMPSLFNIISHLEHNEGAYLPINGMRSIVDSLYELAKEEGVDFVFNSYVDEIVSQENRVKGVKVKNQFIPSDKVISNMDVTNTYQKLLKNVSPKLKLKEQEQSTSALIFQWAVQGVSADLDVHTILFANDYKAEFDALFTTKEIYNDPTIYIYISSKSINTDAPTGCENWFVMINVPHLTSGINWDKELATYRKIIINKINNVLKCSIEQTILHEHCITPVTLANTTHSYLGSLYGNSSNSLLSAFARHANFSKIKGLYFAGGSVHPGGGVPLCLLSAKITAGLIKEGYNA